MIQVYATGKRGCSSVILTCFGLQDLLNSLLGLVSYYPGKKGKFHVEKKTRKYSCIIINTLRTGDADLRFYITIVQDG